MLQKYTKKSSLKVTENNCRQKYRMTGRNSEHRKDFVA